MTIEFHCQSKNLWIIFLEESTKKPPQLRSGLDLKLVQD